MKSEKSKRFCMEQIKRLASKPYYSSEGAPELARTLFEYAQSDDHARRIIDAAVIREFGPEGKTEDRCPGPSELWGLCKQVPADAGNEAKAAARESCTRCHGTGWISVDGPFGTSAAYPCTHQAETESDRRMGVKIPPAQASRYMEESRQADQRHVDFLQKRVANDMKGFHRVTQDDVDALLERLGK